VTNTPKVRIGVDIGGTFTDVALEVDSRRFTAKTLTTLHTPEQGVLSAMHSVCAQASVKPADVQLIIHGTTLATNALIERKGAKTALLTTEGFRDVVEIRHESRSMRRGSRAPSRHSRSRRSRLWRSVCCTASRIRSTSVGSGR
jgi:N-methylhydantoinase A/oxoprolinase/acetone carboxylase beta subunit